MSNNRISGLVDYINLLIKVSETGVNCVDKIETALDALEYLLFHKEETGETLEEMETRKDNAITNLENRCAELYDRLKKYEDVSDLD